ncbi:MAG: calcium-binding protein [Aestuariivirga sp.]
MSVWEDIGTGAAIGGIIGGPVGAFVGGYIGFGTNIGVGDLDLQGVLPPSVIYGTEGDDALLWTMSSEYSVPSWNGLGGNDFLNLQFSDAFPVTAPEFFDGGDGFDTLRIATDEGRSLIMNPGHASIGPGGLDTFSQSFNIYNFERYEILSSWGNDVITTGEGSDWIVSNEGDDLISGAGGDDQIDGGAGKDTVFGGAGIDTIYGGDNSDTLYGGDDRDFIYGGDGNDSLFGDAGDDWLEGGAGRNSLNGGTGNDVLIGGDTANTLIDMSGTDAIYGGAGVDLIRVHASNGDIIDGGLNPNAFGDSATLILDSRYSSAVTGAGGWVFNAGTGAGDRVISGVKGSGLYQVIFHDTQHFDVYGVETFDVTGSNGNDTLTGGNQLDILRGGAGLDRLNGAGGNDQLHGGLGNDQLTGAAGADSFHFDTLLGAANVDTVTDFNAADDTIVLENGIFTLLGYTGTILAQDFKAIGNGTPGGGLDADDHIIYNRNNGDLIYDTNGSAAGGATVFARISAGLNLTVDDFMIV